jgi:hypothetical protein
VVSDHDEAVMSPRVLFAAGSAAASLAGIAPVLSHGATAAATPLRAGAAGIAVSAERSGSTEVVVPAGSARLTGAASGSRALAKRTRLLVIRSSDGATLFTGSVATFRSLAVVPGTKLVVRVVRPAGLAGQRAGTTLSWS